MYTTADLDFAYKYPFTAKAKGIVRESSADKISAETKERILKSAAARVSEAFKNGKIEAYRLRMDSAKLENVLAYPYARLLASSIQRNDLAQKYIRAEAKRCSSFLYLEDKDVLGAIASELGINLKYDGDKYSIGFVEYLQSAPQENQFRLVNQELSLGIVHMNFQKTASFLSEPIALAMSAGFPIPKGQIPKDIIDYSKAIKLPKPKLSAPGRSSDWIENILANPIPDVRQRVVGLILAPYLVNVKKMDPDAAYPIILEYINKCRQIDNSTRITDAQIMYQCKYAKEKGMRPLSFTKAKELLAGIIDLQDEKSAKEKK